MPRQPSSSIGSLRSNWSTISSSSMTLTMQAEARSRGELATVQDRHPIDVPAPTNVMHVNMIGYVRQRSAEQRRAAATEAGDETAAGEVDRLVIDVANRQLD